MNPVFCTHRCYVDLLCLDDEGFWAGGDRTCLTCGWHYPRGRDMSGLRESIERRHAQVIIIDDPVTEPPWTEEQAEAVMRWWNATPLTGGLRGDSDAVHVWGPTRMHEEDLSG